MAGLAERLSLAHARRASIRRELLFAQGDRYDDERIEETMRNLRALGIFALVRIVPVRTHASPTSVGVLVYTRDLWSLRLETGFNGTVATRSASLAARRAQLARSQQAARRALSARPQVVSASVRHTSTRDCSAASWRSTSTFDVIFNRESGETGGQPGHAAS